MLEGVVLDEKSIRTCKAGGERVGTLFSVQGAALPIRKINDHNRNQEHSATYIPKTVTLFRHFRRFARYEEQIPNATQASKHKNDIERITNESIVHSAGVLCRLVVFLGLRKT